MQVRRIRASRLRRAPMRAPAPLGIAAALAIGAALALSACSHPAGSASSGRKVCGTSHTSANVPVSVEVRHGAVSCTTAMTVEKAYADAIDAGKATGNGGAVQVSGWTCQYFTTPQQLKTGDVSKCTKGGAEILATLMTPA